MRTVVAAHHLIVVAAIFGRRERSTAGAVVISRNRKRPVAERIIVRTQQLRRRLSFSGRVQPIVMVARDTHVLATGAGHELPDTDGAGARFRAAVKSRFDRRERNEFRWETSATKDSFHRRAIVFAAQQPLAEALSQAFLNAQ